MGFFSQECHGCEASIISEYAATPTSLWMTDAVVITPDGNIITGPYDGYGRLPDADDAIGHENTVWHKACWEVAGKPLQYLGESPYAQDQGYFFDDDDPRYNQPDPRG